MKRVLLVGAGEQGWESRGPSLLALASEGVELAAIADPDARQLSWTAERLGVARTYATLADALRQERFDAVVLAVPNHLHEPLTLEALAAGCDVLCEKPMALDAAGGARMIDAARVAGRVLAIGYAYPYMHPAVAELARRGGLDSTFRVDAHWIRQDGIPPQPAFWSSSASGAAADLLGHLLSVVRVGLRAAAREVIAHAWQAFGRARHGDAFAGHDTLEALVAFDGGQTARLVVGWAANQSDEESIGVRFHGVERTVDVPLMGRDVDVANFRATCYERGRLPRVLEPDPVQTEVCFVDQARDWLAGEPLISTAEDALTIQAVLDAALASAAASGRPVKVGQCAPVS